MVRLQRGPSMPGVGLLLVLLGSAAEAFAVAPAQQLHKRHSGRPVQAVKAAPSSRLAHASLEARSDLSTACRMSGGSTDGSASAGKAVKSTMTQSVFNLVKNIMGKTSAVAVVIYSIL
eukprot:887-Heterococcus_DN1.PRE.1